MQTLDTNKELKKQAVIMFTNLWDNLIYQVISQQDFYIKEAITHILKAIHLGFVQNVIIDEDIIKINGKKPLEKALIAKIVLPKELFVENEPDVFIGGKIASAATSLSNITQYRLIANAKSNLLVQSATYKVEGLKKLKTELEKIKSDYYKSYYQEYNDSYSRYTTKYKTEIQNSQKISDKINAIKESEFPEEELNILLQKLEETNIPQFEFSYNNQIDIATLQSSLLPASFDLFVEIFSNSKSKLLVTNDNVFTIQSDKTMSIGNQTLQIDSTFETFDNLLSVINEQISIAITTGLENAILPQQQYINLHGATIPVIQNTAITHLAYSCIANSETSILSTRGFVSFAFEVEDNTFEVINAKITAHTNLGYFEENYSNILVVANKILLPASLVNKFNTIEELKIEIIFKNGKEAHTVISQLSNDQVITGILTTETAMSNMRTGVQDTVKRKNFGIKRVGVADYLKVVQSVHAYVPGLVSNIENVMASELRHKSSVSRDYSEITDTTSKYQEGEKLSDTSKTSRTDMQSEIAKELDKQQSTTLNTRFSYNSGAYNFEISGGFASNSAQHDSNRQAVMKSQEITEKAMERVLTKISEERIQKIVKEYTETNVHEFDNRGKVTQTNNANAAKPKHITGVYRWIDIKYKNQIYNYGKRTMFEFMVPEPAKLHRLALEVSKGQLLTAPVDPRKAPNEWSMPNSKKATKELLEYWAQIYKVTLTPVKLTDTQYESCSKYFNYAGNCPIESAIFTVKSGYTCKSLRVNCNFWKKASGGTRVNIGIGEQTAERWPSGTSDIIDFYGLNLSNSFVYKHSGKNIGEISHNLTLNLALNDDQLELWKAENFDLIIKAYQEAYDKFLEEQAKLDEEQSKKEQEQKKNIGQFYRYMEHDVLKHNCVAYLLQDYGNSIGKIFADGKKMDDFQVLLGDDLDQYTALAKFIEQAFEWEIMDYTFYPYYWAKREMWQEMYVSESVDPLFRSFLQAGIARIIVTVKPGFEDAVQFFMSTGKIWNGGEVPVIGDPLYMSIVDEMRTPVGVPQGKYWINKLPTTLTILQDKSTGLLVKQALPIFPENDPLNCENPSELETKSSFISRDSALQNSGITESTLPKN